MAQKPSLSVEDYDSVEFWKQHFDSSSTVSLGYYDMDDTVKLFGVHSQPKSPNGRTVLVIPGWFSLVMGWREVTKELSKEAEVWYIETREKGSSILPKNKVDMSVERMTDDLIQFTQSVGLDLSECVVVASSMGGTVMLEYLGRQNNLPYASILIGPNPEFEVPKRLLSVLLRLPAALIDRFKFLVKWYIRNFKIDMKKEPQQYAKYSNVLDLATGRKIKTSAKDCLWYMAWDHLRSAEIDSKVILVGASSDKMHGAEMTQKIKEVIPTAEYVDFPSNHATHSIEMGEFVLKYV
ncbi:MAG: alpha/beta fold hydrolase [Candidatus Kariarchaeaceae archaeon]